MSPEQKLGRAAAIKNLKQHYKARPVKAEGLGSVVYEETDRGAVIILATILDDLIKAKIEKHFVNLNSSELDALFGPDRPIGSFSARICLAQALGIMDRDTRKMCDLVREMRNACAHSAKGLSFDDKVLVDALQVLWRLLHDKPIGDAPPQHYRVCFGLMVTYLGTLISSGSKERALKKLGELIDAYTGLRDPGG